MGAAVIKCCGEPFSSVKASKNHTLIPSFPPPRSHTSNSLFLTPFPLQRVVTSKGCDSGRTERERGNLLRGHKTKKKPQMLAHLPHTSPTLKERSFSTVGHAQALHRLVSRWSRPWIHPSNGLFAFFYCILDIKPVVLKIWYRHPDGACVHQRGTPPYPSCPVYALCLLVQNYYDDVFEGLSPLPIVYFRAPTSLNWVWMAVHVWRRPHPNILCTHSPLAVPYPSLAMFSV